MSSTIAEVIKLNTPPENAKFYSTLAFKSIRCPSSCTKNTPPNSAKFYSKLQFWNVTIEDQISITPAVSPELWRKLQLINVTSLFITVTAPPLELICKPIKSQFCTVKASV